MIDRPSALTRARVAWGDAPPPWIIALAEACDRTTMTAVARRVGYSAAALSQVINRRYSGNMAAVEQTLRGALMDTRVNCPVVGPLAVDTCLQHQRAPWASHNPQRIAFARACRDCPHSTKREG